MAVIISVSGLGDCYKEKTVRMTRSHTYIMRWI